MSAAINEIRKSLSRGQLLVVVGTGLTAGATCQAESSTWQGLIKHGIQRCVDLGVRDDVWAQRARADVDSPFEPDLIAAAEKTTEALGGRVGAQYKKWLKESVGDFDIKDASLLNALAKLYDAGALIVTTNYDGLIEKHLGLRPTTWRNSDDLQRALRENGSVVHIHGYWEDPASVVFGSSSYADILRDVSAVSFLQASLYTRTVIFVGFGAGLRDPNFSSIRDWMARSMQGTYYQHYRLVRSSEAAVAEAEHINEPISPLIYGADYADLEGFLTSLVAGVVSHPTRSLVTGQPIDEGSNEAGVRTNGISLPGSAPNPESLIRLQDMARDLDHLVKIADSPAEEAAKEAGGGEMADTLKLFVTLFEDEIREVQIIAQQSDRAGSEKVEQALQWGEKLLAIQAGF